MLERAVEIIHFQQVNHSAFSVIKLLVTLLEYQ